ncbi:MAG: endo-1,4-beta-xylanase [Fibrobacteria bacterium]
MTRRSTSALLALSLSASIASAQTATTLKDAAAAVGLNIGIATNSNQVNNATSAYATIVKQQFNMVVCENEMKFEGTENPIGTYKYTGGDAVYTFAAANGMKMRGHNFIWRDQAGPAKNAIHDRTTGLTIMRNHIENVGGHFKTKILEWDVLNEITSGSSLEVNFWRTNIGDDYLDSAFAMSRRAVGNNGYLYYNDFGGDGVNGKSTSMFNLAKKWQTNKVPVDGIGLQCHLGSGFKKDDISANIKRFGDLGLRISLTEIDITNAKASDWTNLLTACLENYNCVSFVTWGLSDANSWIGSNCGCLLYSGSTPAPKTEMIQALITAMAAADPAISAKRKEFAAKGPGGVTGINFPTIQPMRRASGNLQGTASVPVFSIGSGAVVDILGRVPVVPSASAKSLDVLPK